MLASPSSLTLSHSLPLWHPGQPPLPRAARARGSQQGTQNSSFCRRRWAGEQTPTLHGPCAKGPAMSGLGRSSLRVHGTCMCTCVCMCASPCTCLHVHTCAPTCVCVTVFAGQ